MTALATAEKIPVIRNSWRKKNVQKVLLKETLEKELQPYSELNSSNMPTLGAILSPVWHHIEDTISVYDKKLATLRGENEFKQSVKYLIS